MQLIEPIKAQALVDRLKLEAPAGVPWVFDCDGTLIRGDIASLSAWGLIRAGIAHPEQLPPEWEDFKKLPFDYSAFRRLRNIIIEKKGVSAVYEWEALLHTGLPPKTSFEIALIVIEESVKTGSLALLKPICDLAAHFKDRA